MAINRRVLGHLRLVQSGVFSRRQLLENGLTDNDIERLVRRRDLTPVARGVYVDHTGPLTRVQHEWVAVLNAWPAALCLESAIPALRSPVIHIAVDPSRTLEPLPGTSVHRLAHLQEIVAWQSTPPRVRPEPALIGVMSRRIDEGDIAGAYAALTTACFRATSPARVERALARMARVAGRKLITGMLTDLRTGACSVLERGYLNLVERPHGLPRGRRQLTSTATGGRTSQDVHYEKYGVIVELDGRGIHDNPGAWDDDGRRDLAELATSDAVTARVTYGLVFGEHCRTARWIDQILRRHGYGGDFLRCPHC